MIQRIYIDNIRTFVNFEWRPGPVALLLGANGAGKSGLLVTLFDVSNFLLGDAGSTLAFGEASRTRWTRTEPRQTVELDVAGNAGLYRYRVVVEHKLDEPGKNRIIEERLTFDGRTLVEFLGGELRMFRDDGSEGPRFNAKWTRSAVGAIEPGKENRLLTWFKGWVAGITILRPDARDMDADVSTASAEQLQTDLSNFAGWYVGVLSSKPGSVFKALQALASVVPGLEELFVQNGQLHARFDCGGTEAVFRFDELSEGQRQLIALYLLRWTRTTPGHLLAIDEPDNYVSLREVQPWVAEVTELALTKNGPQVWLISHHPEVMNLLASEYGWRFFREANGMSRVERFAVATGLDAAETVARGWEDAG